MSEPTPVVDAGFRRALLARPWLLMPPLVLPWASRAVQGSLAAHERGAVAASGLLAALLVALSAAVFAELWLGDGESLDRPRLLAALRLYFLPLALLALTGPMLWRALEARAEDPDAFLAAIGAASAALRVLGGAGLLWASLALWRWRPGIGPLQALSRGWTLALDNARFSAAVLFWTSAFGYALGMVFYRLQSAFDAARPVVFSSLGFSCDVLLGAVVLVGFVAVPLHAAASGRLVER